MNRLNYLIEFIWYKPHLMGIYYPWIVINVRITSRAPKNIPLKPFQTKSFSTHNSRNPWPNLSMCWSNFISYLSHSSPAIRTITLRFRRGTAPALLSVIFLANLKNMSHFYSKVCFKYKTQIYFLRAKS